MSSVFCSGIDGWLMQCSGDWDCGERNFCEGAFNRGLCSLKESVSCTDSDTCTGDSDNDDLNQCRNVPVD